MNMGAIFAQSPSLVCFAFLSRGVPQVLVEAAACGRAIVTHRLPGCRDVVLTRGKRLSGAHRGTQGIGSTLALLHIMTLRATMGAAEGNRIVTFLKNV